MNVFDENSNLERYAKDELDAIWPDGEDVMDDHMKENVMELIHVFATQGHSGFSAPYCIQLFKKLASFEPLTPLTGEDDEWNLVSRKDNLYQNKRCTSVFKRNGVAYDINGQVFSDDGGETYYGNQYSKIPVEFPYTPGDRYKENYIKLGLG